MKCIVLVGYMCVGKTTVGRQLAKRLNCGFYDLDWYIEERFHKKIPKIFAEEGEERFRDLERRMLHEAAEFENTVLSCGGGTPTRFDNMDYMNEVAETIYLQASPETILAHLKVSKGTRPLLQGLSAEETDQFVRQQLEERAPYYEKAHHIVNVDILDSFEKITDVVNMILDKLETAN